MNMYCHEFWEPSQNDGGAGSVCPKPVGRVNSVSLFLIYDIAYKPSHFLACLKASLFDRALSSDRSSSCVFLSATEGMSVFESGDYYVV